jgi:hypothetical protein
MRSVKWLLATGLIAATTAACTEQYGYPTTAYNNGYYNSYPTTAYNSGYYNNGYYNNGYYSNNGYRTSSSPSYGYGYGYGYASNTPRRGPNGDYDRDGIPNRYDRDANGDGIPDRYQR